MLHIPQHESHQIDLGVFGGSGLYELLADVETVSVETPYGDASGAISIAEVDGVRVGFMPRHGSGHTIPAHKVNYRANIWALAHLGARGVLAPFACGSMRVDFRPGELVVVDQLIDRTTGRECTFFDGPDAWHQHFSDPYDAGLGEVIASVAVDQGVAVHRGGTVVVIPGPRFSTKAESRWHRSIGADLVNMTQYPESVLAAEAGMSYVGLGIVTDFDAGLEEDPSLGVVHQDDVFAVLTRHATMMRSIILAAASPLARSLRPPNS